MKLPPYTYVLALSLVASFSVYYKPKDSDFYLKLFPPFLLGTSIVELLGSYLRYIEVYNVSLYNFFTTFEFCFYLLIISLVIINSAAKKIIRAIILLYAVTAIVNIFFIQKMQTFHTVTYALGCLLVVGACIYYFLELFRLPKSVKLVNNPAFWICSGLLFFYCCSFPLYGLINYWINIKLIIRNFENIVTILNIFLYSLFTIAFLCIRTRKYTSSSS
jgi:hypothetical protein